ncbi:MAG: ABC transporter permease, partial [Acidobacteriota bacterium]
RRQLLATHLRPALTIAAVAGSLGSGLAVVGLRLLATHGPEILIAVRPLAADGRTISFTLGTALVTSTILGLITGLRGHEHPARWLRSGAATPSHERLRTVLVVLQVAVATVLCLGAGTLLVSQAELRRVDPGFDLSGAWRFDLRLPSARYADATAAVGLYDRLLDRLRSLPGVTSAGSVHRLPLAGGGSNNGWSAEDVAHGPDETPAVFATRWASEDYFAAMSIPLLQGRLLEPADRELVRPVAIVSRAVATHFWGDADPLGRRIALGTGEHGPWRTVVGVVDDVRDGGLSEPLDAIVYLPLLTHLPRREAPYAPPQMSFVLRHEGGASDLGSAIRAAVTELDAELPVDQLGPVEDLAREDLATRRFVLSALLATAAVTALLATVGLFGLVAYSVHRRRRELGVRLALGADPGRLRWRVHRRALQRTAIGVVLGSVTALLLGRSVEHLVFGARAVEPMIVVGVVALFALTTLVAADGPARRAATTDPRHALRQD